MDHGTVRTDDYRRRCAANDLLGLSGAIALLMKGLETRLNEEDLQGSLTEEQEERVKSLFLNLHSLAEDVADLAREVADRAREAVE